MEFNIIVNGGPYSSQTAYTALHFTEQALAAGHSVSQVFFYRDGVGQASDLLVPLADEFNSVEAWSRLAQAHRTKLVVCVSAAERRGILNPEQQSEFGKKAHNLCADFEVAGLGQMLEASLGADRTVTFK